MSDVVEVQLGAVRVDASAQLANGSIYQTSVRYSSLEEVNTISPEEKAERAVAQIAEELSGGLVAHEYLVREADELLSSVAADMERTGVFTLLQAQQSDYWGPLTGRGLVAVEALLKRALSPMIADTSVRDLWFEFAGVIAAEEVLIEQAEDEEFEVARVRAWQSWAVENGIVL